MIFRCQYEYDLGNINFLDLIKQIIQFDCIMHISLCITFKITFRILRESIFVMVWSCKEHFIHKFHLRLICDYLILSSATRFYDMFTFFPTNNIVTSHSQGPSIWISQFYLYLAVSKTNSKSLKVSCHLSPVPISWKIRVGSAPWIWHVSQKLTAVKRAFFPQRFRFHTYTGIIDIWHFHQTETMQFSVRKSLAGKDYPGDIVQEL